MSILANAAIIPKPITNKDGTVSYPARVIRPDGTFWMTVYAADPTDPEDYDTGEYFKAGLFGTLKDGIIEATQAEFEAFYHAEPEDDDDDDYTPIFVSSGLYQRS